MWIVSAKGNPSGKIYRYEVVAARDIDTVSVCRAAEREHSQRRQVGEVTEFTGPMTAEWSDTLAFMVTPAPTT